MIHRGRWNGCHLQTLALKGAKNNVRANCVAPAALASHAIRAAITRAKLDKQILFDRMEVCVAGGVESI
jgi:NAD(P)-dependent dehydrogenase (short-subunit alcohol dehydrogenase family)